MICQRCDRGQRYCAGQCRELARKESCQRAKIKYQNSRQGHFNNADRQRRYRLRQKQLATIVTDQGSPTTPCNDLLRKTIDPVKNHLQSGHNQKESGCHFCDASCEVFFRVDFLKQRTTYPYQPKKLLGETTHGD